MKRSRRLWCIRSLHGSLLLHTVRETKRAAWYAMTKNSSPSSRPGVVIRLEDYGYRAVRCRIVTEE